MKYDLLLLLLVYQLHLSSVSDSPLASYSSTATYAKQLCLCSAFLFSANYYNIGPIAATYVHCVHSKLYMAGLILAVTPLCLTFGSFLWAIIPLTKFKVTFISGTLLCCLGNFLYLIENYFQIIPSIWCLIFCRSLIGFGGIHVARKQWLLLNFPCNGDKVQLYYTIKSLYNVFIMCFII